MRPLASTSLNIALSVHSPILHLCLSLLKSKLAFSSFSLELVRVGSSPNIFLTRITFFFVIGVVSTWWFLHWRLLVSYMLWATQASPICSSSWLSLSGFCLCLARLMLRKENLINGVVFNIYSLINHVWQAWPMAGYIFLCAHCLIVCGNFGALLCNPLLVMIHLAHTFLKLFVKRFFRKTAGNINSFWRESWNCHVAVWLKDYKCASCSGRLFVDHWDQPATCCYPLATPVQAVLYSCCTFMLVCFVLQPGQTSACSLLMAHCMPK